MWISKTWKLKMHEEKNIKRDNGLIQQHFCKTAVKMQCLKAIVFKSKILFRNSNIEIFLQFFLIIKFHLKTQIQKRVFSIYSPKRYSCTQQNAKVPNLFFMFSIISLNTLKKTFLIYSKNNLFTTNYPKPLFNINLSHIFL